MSRGFWELLLLLFNSTVRPAETGERSCPGDFPDESLGDLVSHITNTHHKYTREEIARLGPLFAKVCSVHGANHPELLRVRDIFTGLSQELTTHLMKEEMVLFPYIIRMEEAVIEKAPILPPPFGT